MDEEEPGTARPVPRVTDRLDWSATRAAAGPAEEAPPGDATTSAVGPSGYRRPGWGLIAGITAASAVIGGLVGGLLVALAEDDDATREGATASSTATLTGTSFAADAGLADVVARVRPAVVKIESTRHVQGVEQRDVGSGVLIDRSGHVVTNAHVVLETETLEIVLADGSRRPAILVGHDSPFTDIAVLQIGPLADVSPIAVGDSSVLRPGDQVIAIGNPLDRFEGSVTAGIVSGVNRSRVFDEVRQDDLIQTDAALNNGNSGGALLNLKGELIGMPTAVLRENPGAQPVEGIGFAIPSSRVMTIANGIIAEGGAYPRPSLGIEHVDLVAGTQVRACRLSVDSGALVTAVLPGGPSASAGIELCDVVTRIGTDPVDSEHPLLNALAAHKVDDTVTVVLNRSGRIIETDVRLVKRG